MSAFLTETGVDLLIASAAEEVAFRFPGARSAQPAKALPSARCAPDEANSHVQMTWMGSAGNRRMPPRPRPPVALPRREGMQDRGGIFRKTGGRGRIASRRRGDR